ncbi:MAG: amino acid transporter, partial [Alphaproteobacteria bacterium]
ATLIITSGSVHILVVLYSINVFLTFSLSLLGLTIYWIRHRKRQKTWLRKLIVSSSGFIVCFSILLITIIEKFYEGGWITLLITSLFISIGWIIKNIYVRFKRNLSLKEMDFISCQEQCSSPSSILEVLDKKAPTAAIIVDQTFGSGMNCLLQIKKLFPGIFKNFIFVTVGEVDSNTLREEHRWRDMRRKTKSVVSKYKNYCNANGRFAKAYVGYDTDIVEKLTQLTDRVAKDYENVIFFGTKFIFDNENIFTQILFNHVPYIMQRRLHVKGLNMVILPMKIDDNKIKNDLIK